MVGLHIPALVGRAPRVALDLETTGLDPRRDAVLLVGLSAPGFQTNAFRPTDEDWANLRAFLNGPDAPLVIGHNLAFDLAFLWGHGVRPWRLFDTMLAEQLLTAGLDLPADLASVVKRRRGVELDKAVRSNFIGADPATYVPTAEDLAYLAADVVHLVPIALDQAQELTQAGLLRGRDLSAARLEMDTLPAFTAMSLAGFRLDQAAHRAIVADYQARADLAAAQVTDLLGPVWDRLEAVRLGAETPRYESGLAAVKVAQDHVSKVRRDLKTKEPSFTQADLDWAIGELARAREWRREQCPKPKAARPFNLNSRDHVQAALAHYGVHLADQQAQTILAFVQTTLADLGVVLPDTKAATVLAAGKDWPTVASLAVLVPLLEWKAAAKVASTYGQSLVDRIGPDGRVHGSYRQMVSTGRAASSGPNMQNMPPDIRACFVPETGNRLIVMDFSGMELRLAAALSGDQTMIRAFKDGADLHAMTAARAFGKDLADVTKDERQQGKTTNFGVIYGISARGLEARGMAAPGKGQALLDAVASTFPDAMTWRERQGHQALSSGYVRTALGRWRRFPSLGPKPHGPARRDWEKIAAGYRREAGNAPIQGTGADVAKLALARMWAAALKTGEPDPAQPLLGLRFCPVNMVHDEIVLECRAEDADRLLAWGLKVMAQAGRDIVGDAVEIPAEGHVVERWEK